MTEIMGTDACSCDLLANKLNTIIKLLNELQMAQSAGVATGVKKTRQKRKPSAYNLFIGSCLKSKSGKITERMRACAIDWKAKKK